MELNQIMDELKSLGSERTKKIYISNGAQEPVFGVTISAMKPIFKKIQSTFGRAALCNRKL